MRKGNLYQNQVTPRFQYKHQVKYTLMISKNAT